MVVETVVAAAQVRVARQILTTLAVGTLVGSGDGGVVGTALGLKEK